MTSVSTLPIPITRWSPRDSTARPSTQPGTTDNALVAGRAAGFGTRRPGRAGGGELAGSRQPDTSMTGVNGSRRRGRRRCAGRSSRCAPYAPNAGWQCASVGPAGDLDELRRTHLLFRSGERSGRRALTRPRPFRRGRSPVVDPGPSTRLGVHPEGGHELLLERLTAGAPSGVAVGEEWFCGPVGRDPLPRPRTAPVGEAAMGFLVVVPAAEPGGVVEAGAPGFGPGLAVVDLEAPAASAAGDDADRVAGFEGAAVVGPDRAAGVGHGRDLDALGDDDLEDGVGGHAAGDGDGDGAHPGDLALFLVDGVAADEGVVVDEDVDRGLGGCRLVGAGGPAGQVDQGVGPVGVVALVPIPGPGVALHLGAAGVDLGQEEGALVGGEPSREAHGAIAVGPR